MRQLSKKPCKILFVCLGNICRSPAAQGVMEALVEEQNLKNEIFIDSAGTYGGHAGDLPDRRMRVHAQRRGYNLTHKSRQVKYSDFEKFDLIVAMDDANYYDLKSMASTLEDESKIVSMATFLRQHPHNDCIPDPYYEGSEGFELVLDLLEDACSELIRAIRAS